ncbi:hypothetical protein KVR01_013286 [Diaporthe batatas]|uniref:uncharacterized protein n=1 Tax=Diaporthe batatas TaxID=748121 RepID=UPI001D05B6AD|nr:uncharacterized protein KVR01_013286 [Diaporthe batatas]KAG8156873.1 hypothetical protein KVR01_013286 [Diaporthe batatas]
MATDAASLSQAICECGRNHQRAGTRRFGKDGLMAHCLRSEAVKYYDMGIKCFQKWQAKSEENPGWNLADSITWMRKYFDQISITCAEDKRTLGPYPSDSILPVIVGDEEESLKIAKEAVLTLYESCTDCVSENVWTDEPPLHHNNDPDGSLTCIDEALKDAMDAINSIKKAEGASIQDLSDKSYRIWREARRLLCEYERPLVFIIPSNADSVTAISSTGKGSDGRKKSEAGPTMT